MEPWSVCSAGTSVWFFTPSWPPLPPSSLSPRSLSSYAASPTAYVGMHESHEEWKVHEFTHSVFEVYECVHIYNSCTTVSTLCWDSCAISAREIKFSHYPSVFKKKRINHANKQGWFGFQGANRLRLATGPPPPLGHVADPVLGAPCWAGRSPGAHLGIGSTLLGGSLCWVACGRDRTKVKVTPFVLSWNNSGTLYCHCCLVAIGCFHWKIKSIG